MLIALINMNDITKKLDELTAAFTDAENDLFIENRFPYILTKADSYIKIGPEVYRNEDAFDMPRKEWSDEDLSLIMDGCLQIMKGVGYTAEKPFKNLGVRGFNLLFTMLHFTSVGRKTSRLGLGRLQDKISFEHAMDKSRVTYYNLVER
jgi:hypothetical protein